jgi:hypothetical protein
MIAPEDSIAYFVMNFPYDEEEEIEQIYNSFLDDEKYSQHINSENEYEFWKQYLDHFFAEPIGE